MQASRDLHVYPAVKICVTHNYVVLLRMNNLHVETLTKSCVAKMLGKYKQAFNYIVRNIVIEVGSHVCYLHGHTRWCPFLSMLPCVCCVCWLTRLIGLIHYCRRGEALQVEPAGRGVCTDPSCEAPGKCTSRSRSHTPVCIVLSMGV